MTLHSCPFTLILPGVKYCHVQHPNSVYQPGPCKADEGVDAEGGKVKPEGAPEKVQYVEGQGTWSWWDPESIKSRVGGRIWRRGDPQDELLTIQRGVERENFRCDISDHFSICCAVLQLVVRLRL